MSLDWKELGRKLLIEKSFYLPSPAAARAPAAAAPCNKLNSQLITPSAYCTYERIYITIY